MCSVLEILFSLESGVYVFFGDYTHLGSYYLRR